jgi:glycerophosphoryl diester phosphodiesterase
MILMKRIQSILFLVLFCSAGSRIAIAQSASSVMPLRGLCAHRGASETHPENTIPAFMEAIAAGAQMIEFDIQLTKDSVMVIMHDETVDRTTNGKGKVSELTLDYIRQLDAGAKKGAQFAGTRVPTFEEVLAIMPRNVWLNCHLKGGAATGKASAALVAKVQRLHQAFLACGEEAAAAARAVAPGILICNMESKYRKSIVEYAKGTIDLKAQFLQLVDESQLQPAILANLKQHKVAVNYFYAPTPVEMHRYFKAGVDFVLVNNITEVMPLAKEEGIIPVRPQF